MTESRALYQSNINAELPALETDVFRGYAAEDIDRIKRIMPEDLQPDSAFYTDSMGVKISPEYCPWIAASVGSVDNTVPIPGDGYIGEAIEYAAFAIATELSKNRSTFNVVELGAGWGPWVSLAAVNAPRLGFEKVNLVAFEADSTRFDSLRRHLSINNVIHPDSGNEGEDEHYGWRLLNSAAHWANTKLYWPASSNLLDAGMAPTSDPNASVDYRGKSIEHIEINAIDVIEAIDHLDVVDFMHIDIQGGEAELIPNILDALSKKVSVLMIGTHSRKIEGDFIASLPQKGWKLFRERPCQFYSMANAPTLEGLTYIDGAQMWVNMGLDRN